MMNMRAINCPSLGNDDDDINDPDVVIFFNDYGPCDDDNSIIFSLIQIPFTGFYSKAVNHIVIENTHCYVPYQDVPLESSAQCDKLINNNGVKTELHQC